MRVEGGRLRADGAYVLYWMIAQRRTRWSFALQHAVAQARALGVPLLVLEPLRVGYRWASPRFHAFVVQGMADNAARCAAAGVRYLAYVEPEEGAGSGLLEALAADAALVVTDDYPTFFLPEMVRAAGARLPVRLDVVDGCGVVPMRGHGREFTVAHSFRRHLHKTLRPHLHAPPEAEPLAGYDLGWAQVPGAITERWRLISEPDALRWPALCPPGLVGGPGPAPIAGGARAGEAQLAWFLRAALSRFDDDRNQPDLSGASGLSPYLHFGHVSGSEVVHAALAHDGWTAQRLNPAPTGQRHGWWGAAAAVESFLDEVLTWRELGYAWCAANPGMEHRYDALPDWARESLAEHASDPRPARYTLEQLAGAETHDRVWNAAQRQLVREGRVHNYMRMLWGKNVLAWTESPQQAFAWLIELNNRYALDGRDPNSYAGIGWVFGRFDRAWGPERPIFGKVRYMTSEAALRKLDMRNWLARWS